MNKTLSKALCYEQNLEKNSSKIVVMKQNKLCETTQPLCFSTKENEKRVL